MRLFFTLTLRCLFLIVCLPALRGAVDNQASLKAAALRCASAWERRDLDAIASSLPPRVVTRFGGRAAVLRELKTQFAQASSFGVEKWEVQMGKLPTARAVGPWLTVVLPVTAVAHGPHVDVTQQSHVLALSTDQGKHWSFLPFYGITQKELESWFPEFAGKIIVPPDPSPQMEFVY